MTWTPIRPAILSGALTASLALAALLLPAGARAARAYVSNEDDGTVTVIDTQRLAALATVTVGKRPRGLVLSPDGASLYVALTGLPKCPPPIPEEQCAKLPRDRRADGVAGIHTPAPQPAPRVEESPHPPTRQDHPRGNPAVRTRPGAPPPTPPGRPSAP